jgi:hypothetical protein
MTKPSSPTKADLHRMLAEAVRNTQPQPQPANPQSEPSRDVRPGLKRKTPTNKARRASKLTAKIKNNRASNNRKRPPR